MSCEKYIEMISQEIDGELAQNHSLQLMSHLAQCADCKKSYGQTLRLQEMVFEDKLNSATIEIPSNFSKNVIRRIEKEAPPAPQNEQTELKPLSSFFDRFLPKAQPFFLKPAFSWSFAAMTALIISFAFLNNASDNTQRQALLDAKGIEPKVIASKDIVENEADKDSINYYVERHSEVNHKSIKRPASRKVKAVIPVIYRNAGKRSR